MSSSTPPYFEDLRVGELERSAPAVTLSDGIAAVHQAIVGDRLALALDAQLAREVLGADAPIAHPALVWDVAIGQSTLLTGRVIANLFYRGLTLQRAPLIGDTLRTSTEVVALRQSSPRAGRAASGLAVLRVRTSDQHERGVLDFWRCAMLPLRDPGGRTGAADSFEQIAAELAPEALRAMSSRWDLSALAGGGEPAASEPSGAWPGALAPGARWALEPGDVVSSAPELARLTLNVAAVHRDATAQRERRRLVYGGHTIGIAAAQATRALPQIATIVGWHSCDHLAPVFEGDTLHSELELERCEPLGAGEHANLGSLAHLRSRVRARAADLSSAGDQDERDVLDWRFVALVV